MCSSDLIADRLGRGESWRQELGFSGSGVRADVVGRGGEALLTLGRLKFPRLRRTDGDGVVRVARSGDRCQLRWRYPL